MRGGRGGGEEELTFASISDLPQIHVRVSPAFEQAMAVDNGGLAYLNRGISVGNSRNDNIVQGRKRNKKFNG